MRWILRSKIHHATVTFARVDYVGSITIDEDLMERVGLIAGERVLVVDNTNGARVETYVMVGERGAGEVGMNGASAHLIHEGDQVIIMGFELADGPLEPKVALVDEGNRFVRYL